MDIRAKLEAAVLAAIDRACAGPARWGTDDCALWCADAVKGVLGYDPAFDFRGRYADREGAQFVAGPLGLAFALRRAARRHGWKLVGPISAQPGDIGVTLVAGQSGPTTVICRAPGWFVARTEAAGFAALPAAWVRIAWSVV